MGKGFATGRIGIIVNPIAGTLPLTPLLVQWLVELLKEEGFTPEVQPTRYAGHAHRLAASLAQNQDLVIAVGGDGTVNEVARGLMGSAVPLAVVPVGTANVLAKELRLPRDIPELADVIARGKVKQMDMGKADGRYFVLFGSVGFDARVTAELKRIRSGHISYLDYLVPLMRAFNSYIPHRFEVRVDGKLASRQACHLVIGNIRSYGGPLEITSRAKPDDGLLDVCIFLGARKRDVVRYVLSSIVRMHLEQSDVLYHVGRVIELQGARNAPCQLDGDFRGPTPTRFEVVPRALKVIVP